MNIKTTFIISIFLIYCIKIIWNVYLHIYIDELDTDNVSSFFKGIATLNVVLSCISLVIFHKYLDTIEMDKYTKYTTYILFATTILLECVKVYVFTNPNAVIDFHATLRGITATLSLCFAITVGLTFYTFKNKVSEDLSSNSIDLDNMDDLDKFIKDDDLFDLEIESELENMKTKQSAENSKMQNLEKQLAETKMLLEKAREQRKIINVN
jgi:hypothetical protein